MDNSLKRLSYLQRSITSVYHRKYSQRSEWKCTIGLEVHAQLATATKLFSSAKSVFASPVNTNVNQLDASIPGTLPVVNKRSVELAVKTSLALSCQVNPVSHFDRKHYFYADLPCGYQITQQRSPISMNGRLDFTVFTPGIHALPYKKSCRLKQIQLEQDSGKSLHDDVNQRTLIDLNRAGVGLMEFVFEPDLSDGEEAAALVKELTLILQRLGSCNCKMEEGALRVDANISMSQDPTKLGVRTEVKNIGSIRGVANAIKYESLRQVELLEKGGKVLNETRSWDPQNKKTVVMRDKEDKQDYRFMPEPNLAPLRVCVSSTDSVVSPGTLDMRHVVNSLPQLPEVCRTFLVTKYGFSDVYALMLVNQPKLHTYFGEIMSENRERDAKVVWNLLIVQLMNVFNKSELDLETCKLNAKELGEVSDLVSAGIIDLETCRDIFHVKLLGSQQSAADIVSSRNWRLVSDPVRIEAICQEIVSRNEKTVKKLKKGKKRALQTLVNDVANVTTDKINLSLVSKRLKEIFDLNSPTK